MGGVFRKSGFTPAALAPALWLDATRGVLTDGAAQFTAANSESLSNAGLALGNTDWWLAGWVYADSLPANACIITKDDGGTTDINYNVLHSAGSFQFAFRNLAGSFVTVSGAGLTTGAWKFFIAYHDSVNDLIGVSVNGGAFTTAATGGITPNSATSAPFRLGARATVAALFWDGRQDSMCVGNAPVGGIAGLATTIRDSLYNAGAGKCYSDLTDAEKTAWGLVSFWNLDEISGTRSDAHGSNHLTDNNTVTYAAGLASEGVDAGRHTRCIEEVELLQNSHAVGTVGDHAVDVGTRGHDLPLAEVHVVHVGQKVRCVVFRAAEAGDPARAGRSSAVDHIHDATVGVRGDVRSELVCTAADLRDGGLGQVGAEVVFVGVERRRSPSERATGGAVVQEEHFDFGACHVTGSPR
jgi:hypothetical protein